MRWFILNEQSNMAEMGTEPDPESKIWKLTGRSGLGAVLIFGVNFPDSIHLC